jgi:hypothetical protein
MTPVTVRLLRAKIDEMTPNGGHGSPQLADQPRQWPRGRSGELLVPRPRMQICEIPQS